MKTTKKLAALFFSFIFLAAALPTAAFADSTLTFKEYGDSLRAEYAKLGLKFEISSPDVGEADSFCTKAYLNEQIEAVKGWAKERVKYVDPAASKMYEESKDKAKLYPHENGDNFESGIQPRGVEIGTYRYNGSFDVGQNGITNAGWLVSVTGEYDKSRGQVMSCNVGCTLLDSVSKNLYSYQLDPKYTKTNGGNSVYVTISGLVTFKYIKDGKNIETKITGTHYQKTITP